jgi:ABC-type dipeptide/oligopeptide/nickel transport system permease component
MARRIGAGLLTLCTVLALTFIVYWAVPTQPANFVYPEAPSLTNYQVAHANHLLGLDRPKVVQYLDYL